VRNATEDDEGREGVLTPSTVWKRGHIGEPPSEEVEGDMGWSVGEGVAEALACDIQRRGCDRETAVHAKKLTLSIFGSSKLGHLHSISPVARRNDRPFPSLAPLSPGRAFLSTPQIPHSFGSVRVCPLLAAFAGPTNHAQVAIGGAGAAEAI